MKPAALMASMSVRREVEIFERALELPPPERPAYVQDACGDDRELAADVLRLLAAHEAPDSLLDGVVALDEESDLPEGTVIGGKYRLGKKLGEGGFGVVYSAEQFQPVRRSVALKILKAGRDSRQVLSRLGQERQALAMMDHPGMARFLDGGTTDQSRPYFVMELVKGIPITDYCQSASLALQDRLELFLKLCQAVHHAHQKGVIHRDLKPSNVLVARSENEAVVKVIDFGVAKAIREPLIDNPVSTMVGQLVGTWEYMSPEQAVLKQLEVDSRTDVYSLGVMLYELLTGVTPLDGARLRSAALDETLRMIREEQPSPPSTHLGLGETIPNETTKPTRPVRDARRARRLLREQLDWIVLKALEKDRQRRYQNVNELAEDIRGCLRGEPISARPPSWPRRWARWLRGHRTALQVGSYFVVLAAGFAGSWMLVSGGSMLRSGTIRADCEDAGPDGTIVTSVLVGDIRITIEPSNGKLMTARTYDVGGAYQAFSRGEPISLPNAPAPPARVSGKRFISTVVVGNFDLKVAAPIRFRFSRPVCRFGFTTLDLMEAGIESAESITLTAFDAEGQVLATHRRVGPQGEDGLALVWSVASDQANIDHVVLESTLTKRTGYGIDDFVVGIEP